MERVITMSIKELSRLEVMQRLERGELKQSQATNILKLSTRQTKRLWNIYKHKVLKASFPRNEEQGVIIICPRKSKKRLWS